MADLQEIILRGKFIFNGAPTRYEVFNLINGKISTKEISRKTGRRLSSVCHDVEKLKDFDLIIEKKNDKGEILRKEKAIIYEKTPLVKHIPQVYYKDVSETTKLVKTKRRHNKNKISRAMITTPNENEILDICKDGEDQLYEFKAPGVKMEVLSEEIAAFLHTKIGGIIFYGIDDDGTIIGSNLTKQDFDQRIQNSIRTNITPSPNIEIIDKNVLGTKIILIKVPPWDKKTIYQYTKKERYLIRKGTNKFALKPEELKKLSKGEYIT